MVSFEERKANRDRDLANYRFAIGIFRQSAPWKLELLNSGAKLGLESSNRALEILRYLSACTSRISTIFSNGPPGLVHNFYWNDFPDEERASDRP
jgi:hypothetical protein